MRCQLLQSEPGVQLLPGIACRESQLCTLGQTCVTKPAWSGLPAQPSRATRQACCLSLASAACRGKHDLSAYVNFTLPGSSYLASCNFPFCECSEAMTAA